MGTNVVSEMVTLMKDHPYISCSLLIFLTPPFFPILKFFSPLLISTALFIVALVTMGPQFDQDDEPHSEPDHTTPGADGTTHRTKLHFSPSDWIKSCKESGLAWVEQKVFRNDSWRASSLNDENVSILQEAFAHRAEATPHVMVKLVTRRIPAEDDDSLDRSGFHERHASKDHGFDRHVSKDRRFDRHDSRDEFEDRSLDRGEFHERHASRDLPHDFFSPHPSLISRRHDSDGGPLFENVGPPPIEYGMPPLITGPAPLFRSFEDDSDDEYDHHHDEHMHLEVGERSLDAESQDELPVVNGTYDQPPPFTVQEEDLPSSSDEEERSYFNEWQQRTKEAELSQNHAPQEHVDTTPIPVPIAGHDGEVHDIPELEDEVHVEKDAPLAAGESSTWREFVAEAKSDALEPGDGHVDAAPGDQFDAKSAEPGDQFDAKSRDLQFDAKSGDLQFDAKSRGLQFDAKSGDLHFDAKSGDHFDANSGDYHFDANSGDHFDANSGDHFDANSGDHLDANSGDHLDAKSGDHDFDAKSGDHFDAKAAGDSHFDAEPDHVTQAPTDDISKELPITEPAAPAEDAVPVEPHHVLQVHHSVDRSMSLPVAGNPEMDATPHEEDQVEKPHEVHYTLSSGVSLPSKRSPLQPILIPPKTPETGPLSPDTDLGYATSPERRRFFSATERYNSITSISGDESELTIPIKVLSTREKLTNLEALCNSMDRSSTSCPVAILRATTDEQLTHVTDKLKDYIEDTPSKRFQADAPQLQITPPSNKVALPSKSAILASALGRPSILSSSSRTTYGGARYSSSEESSEDEQIDLDSDVEEEEGEDLDSEVEIVEVGGKSTIKAPPKPPGEIVKSRT